MNQSFYFLILSWGALGVIVLFLAAYRSQLSRKEDDQIHINDGDAGVVVQQAQVSHRIDVVERWGKTLTVVLVLYGLALGGYYLYTVWQTSSNSIVMQ